MKIARKIPLSCCILSMAYLAGCTLEEPNDLEVKCYGENNNEEIINGENNKLSIIINIANSNINDSKKCTSDDEDPSCSNYSLNFETGFCPKGYSCIINTSNSDHNYICIDSYTSLKIEELVNAQNITNEDSTPSMSLLCPDTHYFKEKPEDNICYEIMYQQSSTFSPESFGYCCLIKDVACLAPKHENNYCKHGWNCIFDDSNAVCSKEESPQCGQNNHFVSQTEYENADPKDKLDIIYRCRNIQMNSEYKFNPKSIGYCCEDTITHCGNENNNCTKLDGWKSGICQNGNCQKCETYQHINNEGICENDSDAACGINLDNCELISTQTIPHASGTHFTCIDGSCQLKCNDTYKANEDNTYCFSDSDIEHCGSQNMNCNALIPMSTNGLSGFDCKEGRCTPVCYNNYKPHIPNGGDIQDGYYCAASCDDIQCGANSECNIYYNDCLAYSGVYKTCIGYNEDDKCEKYRYYSYYFKYDDNNVPYPPETIEIDEDDYSNNIKDIQSKPLYRCLEQSDTECTAHQYCSFSVPESKCDCIDGYEYRANKCVPICKDGEIDIYWEGSIVKARCIQSEKDLDYIDCKTSGFYYLKNDINLGTMSKWSPICSNGNPFKGIFLGNNHTIQANLTCNTETELCGLFGNVQNSTFNDLYLNMTIVNPADRDPIAQTGSLAANATNSTFSNIHIYGFEESNAGYTGGVIGNGNHNTLTGCSFSGSIKSQYAGGIVGSNNDSFISISPKAPDSKPTTPTVLTHCHASGSLNGANVGGLIAESNTIDAISISQSSFSGIINGEKVIGGLIGTANNTFISNSYVINAELSGNDNYKSVVGGLVGSGEKIDIKKSYVSHSNLTGYIVGGLIAKGSDLDIINYTPSPPLNVIDISPINLNTTLISTSYFDGTIKTNSIAGGLVGSSRYTRITDSAVFGYIYNNNIHHDQDDSTTGGFVGQMNTGYIIGSMSTSDIIDGRTVGFYGGKLIISDMDFLRSHKSFNPTKLSPMYIANSYITGKYYTPNDSNIELSLDMNIYYYSLKSELLTLNQCSPLNSGPCYNSCDNDTIASYYKEEQKMYLNLKTYINYITHDQSLTPYNDDVLLINILNPDERTASFENRLCTISTGPASEKPGVGIPTQYVLPIPKSLPPVPFCKPYPQ